MKKNLLYLAILSLLLLGIYYFQESKKNEVNSRLYIQSADLIHLNKIKLSSGTLIKQSTWVDEATNYPLDQTSIKKFLDFLRNIRITGEITYSDQKELDKFFNLSSSLSFEFVTGTRSTLRVGDLVPDSEQFYLLQDEKLYKAVYDLPAEQSSEVNYYGPQDKLKLIHDLFTTNNSLFIQHQPIKLFIEAAPIEIKYETSNQFFISQNSIKPAPALIFDQELIERYLNQIFNISVVSVRKFEDKNQKVKDVLWLKTEKSQLKLTVFENYQNLSQVYFRIQDYPWIFELRGEDASLLTPNYQRFLPKTIAFLNDLKKLNELEFNYSFDDENYFNAHLTQGEKFEVTSKTQKLNQALWAEVFKILFFLPPYENANYVSELLKTDVKNSQTLFIKFNQEKYSLHLNKDVILLSDMNKKMKYSFFMNTNDRVAFDFIAKELLLK